MSMKYSKVFLTACLSMVLIMASCSSSEHDTMTAPNAPSLAALKRQIDSHEHLKPLAADKVIANPWHQKHRIDFKAIVRDARKQYAESLARAANGAAELGDGAAVLDPGDSGDPSNPGNPGGGSPNPYEHVVDASVAAAINYANANFPGHGITATELQQYSNTLLSYNMSPSGALQAIADFESQGRVTPLEAEVSRMYVNAAVQSQSYQEVRNTITFFESQVIYTAGLPHESQQKFLSIFATIRSQVDYEESAGKPFVAMAGLEGGIVTLTASTLKTIGTVLAGIGSLVAGIGYLTGCYVCVGVGAVMAGTGYLMMAVSYIIRNEQQVSIETRPIMI